MNILKKSLLALALTGMSSFALAAPIGIGLATADIKVTATGSIVTTACKIEAAAVAAKLPKVSTAILTASTLSATTDFDIAVTACAPTQLDVTIVAESVEGNYMLNQLAGATKGEGAALGVAMRRITSATATKAQIDALTYTNFALGTPTGVTATTYAGNDKTPGNADDVARGKIYMRVGYVKDPTNPAPTAKAGNFSTKFVIRANYK